MSYIGQFVAKLNRIRVRTLRAVPALTSRASKNGKINWWLVYGAERTGTSLMFRMVGMASLRTVSDWGLGDMLKLTPEYSYIKFDRERALGDISRNILDNAGVGGGTKLDLVFKQASISIQEYQMVVKMWGYPSRRIFCFREPSGYIASAIKKFPDSSLSHLQAQYIESFKRYEEIGGDIFEYSARVTKQHYIEFLAPTVPTRSLKEEFHFRGTYEPQNASDDMWAVYHEFKQKHHSRIFPIVQET